MIEANNSIKGPEVLTALKEKFPKELLAFYRKGMNQGVSSVARENYVHQAQAAARVRRVLVDIMKQPEEWRRLKNELKLANHKRPAFQEEFAKAIPDW